MKQSSDRDVGQHSGSVCQEEHAAEASSSGSAVSVLPMGAAMGKRKHDPKAALAAH